ncbi:hypothetical protein [Pontiella desulfatans]|uniref:hypothetical protein n=1 Tax=Pontiella desulfatans TaxID=2750659 RepID=UPI00109D7065|nr:hypothetical protein [Pontiella desulfatans]
MKIKTVIISFSIVSVLVLWNIRELPDFRVDASKVKAIAVPDAVDVPQLDWSWFDEVEVVVREGVCSLVSIPPQLEALDGKEVVVAGPSFACGDDLVERMDGYTIKGFIMVPYFGMIDCCVGNPVPYFQWTIVVEKLATPWEINHKGIIDPDVVVRGILRIERGSTQEGVFFLEEAEVIHSADAEKQAG